MLSFLLLQVKNSLQQIEVVMCSRMRIRWGGIGCQTSIISLYLHTLLPSLALCVYLGSGCSWISSALPWPLPLPSNLPTQVESLPAASQQACTSGRETVREMDRREGRQRLQHTKNIQKEKVCMRSQYEENF